MMNNTRKLTAAAMLSGALLFLVCVAGGWGKVWGAAPWEARPWSCRRATCGAQCCRERGYLRLPPGQLPLGGLLPVLHALPARPACRPCRPTPRRQLARGTSLPPSLAGEGEAACGALRSSLSLPMHMLVCCSLPFCCLLLDLTTQRPRPPQHAGSCCRMTRPAAL